MAMAGFPVVGFDPKRLQLGIAGEQPSGFHIGYKGRTWMQLGQITGHDDADLIGKYLFAFVIHNTATIAITIKP